MKKTFKKYNLTQNSYLKTFFFGLVILSAAFILRDTFVIEQPTAKIKVASKAIDIDNNEKETITDLRNYLNEGNNTTPTIYSSMYNLNGLNNELDDETMYYIAYNYITKTTPINEFNELMSCDLLDIGIDCNEILINTFINKDILKETIKKIFNKDINTYPNFYTYNDNMCIYKVDDYICEYHNLDKDKNKINIELIDYNIEDNKIEIIEKYSYYNIDNIYKGFQEEETGSQIYKSTFIKENDNYYWNNTNKIS